MCSPLTMAVFGGGLSALQIGAQNQAANAANRALEKSSEIANRNFQRRQEELNTQKNIQQANAVEQANKANLNASKVASAVRMSARDSGISGVGVERLVSDVGAQLSSQLSLNERNLRNSTMSLELERQSAFRNLEGINRQLQSQAQEGIGLIEGIVKIGQGAYGGLEASQQFGSGDKTFKDLFTPGKALSDDQKFKLDDLKDKIDFENDSLGFLDEGLSFYKKKTSNLQREFDLLNKNI